VGDDLDAKKKTESKINLCMFERIRLKIPIGARGGLLSNYVGRGLIC